MKLHHKVGGRKGKPAYRTPSSFKNNVKVPAPMKSSLEIIKASNKRLYPGLSISKS